jgi:protein-tyrosine phosphatase
MLKVNVDLTSYGYWVRSDQFFAGEYPRKTNTESLRERIDRLILAGITAFIDLTEANECLLPYSGLLKTASYQRFPIKDFSIPRSKETTVAILNAIDYHIEARGMVYLHCMGGVGRTGMIVGCWLARNSNKGESPLIELQKLWNLCPKSNNRRSPETYEQEQYILKWEESK